MIEGVKKTWTFDAEYNGKEEGCGDLILNLFLFFKSIKPGMCVCVTAYDKGAANDISAWCRSTGKILLESSPPYYLIQKVK